MPTNPILKDKIGEIKALLRDKPRDLALFIIGINTGLRCSDLLKLRLSHFDNSPFYVEQKKTGEIVEHMVNDAIKIALSQWREAHPDAPADAFLFYPTSKSWQHAPIFNKHICEDYTARLVKRWCAAVGLHDSVTVIGDKSIRSSYAMHSLRKACGLNYLLACTDSGLSFGESLIATSAKLGHKDPRTTLVYIGLGRAKSRELQLAVNL